MLTILVSLCVLFVLMMQGSIADESETAGETCYYLQGDTYKLGKDKEYNYSESDRVEEMPFGRKYAGFFFVSGEGIKKRSHESYVAIGSQGTVTFGYEYDNSLKESKKGKWSIEDDGQRKVKDKTLYQDVDSGAVIVERSYDTVDWTVVERRYDFFDSHPSGEPHIYTTTEEDVKHGAYYRVTVAYRIEKSTGVPWKRNPRAECVEVYTFYVGEYESTLHVREVYSGGEIPDPENATITHGFSLMCDSTASKIYVKGPNDVSEFMYPHYSVFTTPGDYLIRVRTPLEDDYRYTVNIREGAELTELTPTAYEGNESYKDLKALDSPVGKNNMTSLFVEQTKGYTIKKAEVNGLPAISVSGETVTLYLQLNYAKEISAGFQLADDSYGKKGEELFGVALGEIESGALVIQTSKDGQNWENIDAGRYSNGLYTTDFQNQYGSGRRVAIYTPNGQEVLEGLYVRVIYAFEADEKKETHNYVEEYTFFLSNSNVNAVVFHNISADDKIQEVLSEEDQNTVEIYKRAETLEDYTQTLSGFRVDNSLNPTVTYEIKRDGQSLTGNATTFVETGKYEITMNAVGASKKITIFVDRTSSEDSMKRYFGDGFLSGKRIYAETGYPVYVAGLTSYNILEVSNNELPVSGTIKNLTTGSVIEIPFSRNARTEVLTEPGEYVAKFYTNKTFLTSSPVGDTKIFTFRFYIIPESETPGPVVNQNALKEYCTTNVSDLCPRYYGVTYPSAGKGFITLAFATWQDAYDYASAQEESIVELHDDGTFYYRDEFLAQKEEYDDSWAVEDSIDYFVRQAIREYFFDMSNDYAYITLPQETLDNEGNLRKLELDYSVVVFGEEQREKLLVKNALPIISPKKHAYIKIEDGSGKEIIRGEPSDYQFIKDKYEFDSQKIVVISGDNTYPISYHEGVGKQLEAAGCASGKVHILELNKYNDQNDYEAVFIREGENLATVTLKTIVGNQETNIVVDQKSEVRKFEAEAFRPISIVDDTDPYAYIRIAYNGEKQCLLNSELDETDEKFLYVQPGDYTISCINRLGYSFEFVITIQEGSRFTAIRCIDDKEVVQEVICTYKGSKDVSLPVLTRIGYTLTGYTDNKGVEYPLVISEVDFTGNVTLKAKWQPKDCTIEVVDQDYVTLTSVSVKFHENVDLYKLCADAGIVPLSFAENDDKVIIDGKYCVKSEGNIVIVAQIDKNTEGNSSEKAGSYKTKFVVGISIAIIVLLLGGFVVFAKKGKKSHEENQ